MQKKYKIGQLSKVYGISPDSLRYYESIGILNPKRDKNNYRLYSTKDIYTLNILKELRSLGFSFSDIKDHLQDFDLASTLQLFEKEVDIIHKKMEELKELEEILLARIERIENNQNLILPTEPTIKQMKERKILSLSETVYLDEELDFVIKNIQNSVDEFYIIGRGEIGTTLPLERISKGEYGHFNSAFFITHQADTYNDIIKAGNYLSMGVYGTYDQLPKAWRHLFNYIEENDLSISGNPLELYIVDNHATSNPEEYITELQIPLLH